MEIYNLKIEEVYKKLSTASNGISEEEAKKRLAAYGPNKLKEEKKPSLIMKFLEQFKSPLVLILLVAVLISAIIGEVLDSAIIAIIVFLAATLGFVQEYRAEKAMEELKKLSAPKAKVVREGKIVLIDAESIVPGDVLFLEEGDRVPADARVVEEFQLRADEASLTGESTPVQKSSEGLVGKVPVAERKNVVFAGTTIVRGHGKAVVYATGMETEFGKIAKMLQEEERPKTPLQIKMEEVGRFLGIAALFIVFIVAGIEFMLGMGDLLSVFIWAIALAVAAVPEALPAVVTTSLALGMRKMAKKNAIVRKLDAVEALGSVNVICTDKTGTLTKNEMTVKEIFASEWYHVKGVGYKPEGKILHSGKVVDPSDESTRSLYLALKIGALCNNAHLVKEDGMWKVHGDPTEGALLVSAAKAGLFKEELEKNEEKVGEIPFSSERKTMSTVHKANGKYFLYSKGAPEVIISKCKYVLLDGKKKILTKNMKEEILKNNRKMASNALRVLAMAYREIKKQKNYDEEDERDLIFVGMQGMIDPPRAEVAEAIKICQEAGIRVIMVTGDQRATAEAIAKQIGLKGKVYEGEEIDDANVDRIVEDAGVVARASPEHKLKIVKALKKKGYVVAVTGDGINDAPALKTADVGVAMGITGTDVTKEAGSMVLADDNFATIVSAVEEGRSIYDNIRKYLFFLLSCNLSEIALMFVAALFGLPVPLLAIHLLYINLATDGLPAIALGVEPPDKDVMKRKPRQKKESVFAGMKTTLLLFTAYLTLSLFALFLISLPYGIEKARTVVLAGIVLAELANAFNSKSIEKSIFKLNIFANKWLLLAILWETLLLSFFIFTPFSSFIKAVQISPQELALPILIALGGIVVIEVAKFFIFRKSS
ncbi:MAG: cation-translocating P-type ATPase [Candidatus Anstonellales archaeon]